MRYFETHAHPDHPLVQDKEEYINSMREVGIENLVIAPITYESNYTSMELFPKDKYPGVYFAKGLHPKYALNLPLWDEKQKEDFCELFKDSRVVAVKTGLDFSKKKIQEHQKKRQYDYLKLFMSIAAEYQKPLVLHIREAAEEAIKFFGENPIMVPAEIHCFTYDKDMMMRFIDVGVKYFGIGGMVTRSDNYALQEAVKLMPLEMILVESDAPFVKIDGETSKYNTSDRAIPAVVKKIAEIKGITEEKVAKVTYANAFKFFWYKEIKEFIKANPVSIPKDKPGKRLDWTLVNNTNGSIVDIDFFL